MRATYLLLALLLLTLALHEVCGGFTVVEARKKHKKKKKPAKKKKKKSKTSGGNSRCALFDGMSSTECDDLISKGCRVHWVGACAVKFGGGCKQYGNCAAYGCAGQCSSDPTCSWIGGSCQTRTSPTMSPTASPVPLRLALGNYFSYFKENDSFVAGWGDNGEGELGLNTTSSPVTVPTQVSLIGGEVSQIAAGGQHSCALLTTGVVQCWGSNADGQLGLNNTSPFVMIPTTVSLIDGNVSQIALGELHSCALLTNGTVQCWGNNKYGQLGLNSTDSPIMVPTTVTKIGEKVSQIALGVDHTCVVLFTTGALQCWGYNRYGQLGLNTTSDTPVTVPTTVSSIGGKVSQVALGAYHSCAVLTTGSLHCWGDNSIGQLGLNTTSGTPVTVPTTVSLIGGTVSQVSLGTGHSCALLTTGVLQCWGYNRDGELGLNNTSSFVMIPTTVSLIGGTVSQIALGGYHSCALLTTDAVQCWGFNFFGQLGLSNNTNTSVAIPSYVSGYQ